MPVFSALRRQNPEDDIGFDPEDDIGFEPSLGYRVRYYLKTKTEIFLKQQQKPT